MVDKRRNALISQYKIRLSGQYMLGGCRFWPRAALIASIGKLAVRKLPKRQIVGQNRQLRFLEPKMQH